LSLNLSAVERRLRAQIAANTAWANAANDPNTRADYLDRAHRQRLAFNASQARRLAREAAANAADAEAEARRRHADAVQAAAAAEAALKAAGGVL